MGPVKLFVWDQSNYLYGTKLNYLCGTCVTDTIEKTHSFENLMLLYIWYEHDKMKTHEFHMSKRLLDIVISFNQNLLHRRVQRENAGQFRRQIQFIL